MDIERSIAIDAPREKVWTVLTDVERWPEWTASVTSVALLAKVPFDVGSGESVWRTVEDVLHRETYTGSFRRPTEHEVLTITAQEAIWLKDTKETMSTQSRRRSKRLSAALTSPTSQR